jgi:hypothetical protein
MLLPRGSSLTNETLVMAYIEIHTDSEESSKTGCKVIRLPFSEA